MGDNGGGPLINACPIISAVSELKQFSDYPKCQPTCAWWDQVNYTCAVITIARGIGDMQGLAEAINGLGWDVKQNVGDVLRAFKELLTDGNMRMDLQTIVRGAADKARRIEQHQRKGNGYPY